MSEIRRDHDGHITNQVASNIDAVAKGACFVCGGRPDAFWFGGPNGFVFVCSACAQDKLPLLIADAISGKTRPDGRHGIGSFDRGLERVSATYWRGAAAAMARVGATHANRVARGEIRPEGEDLLRRPDAADAELAAGRLPMAEEADRP